MKCRRWKSVFLKVYLTNLDTNVKSEQGSLCKIGFFTAPISRFYSNVVNNNFTHNVVKSPCREGGENSRRFDVKVFNAKSSSKLKTSTAVFDSTCINK